MAIPIQKGKYRITKSDAIVMASPRREESWGLIRCVGLRSNNGRAMPDRFLILNFSCPLVYDSALYKSSIAVEFSWLPTIAPTPLLYRLLLSIMVK